MTDANRNNQTTRELIENAITAMQEAGCSMTISGVAKEAGVSNSTIHNRYPDLAAKIRELISKEAARDGKSSLPKQIIGRAKTSKEKMQALKDELAHIKKMLADTNSVNASLDQENQSLKADVEELKRHLAKVFRRK